MNEDKKQTGEENPYFNREIESLHKACKGGNLGALKDVICYCQKFQKSLPGWAAEGLYALIDDQITGNIKKKKGRHSTWMKKYKQDMIDFERYAAVVDFVEHGIRWLDVYDLVSEDLKDTYAAGKSDAIKKSYSRFKQRLKTEPSRYKLLRTIRTPDMGRPFTKERKEFREYVESLRRKK